MTLPIRMREVAGVLEGVNNDLLKLGYETSKWTPSQLLRAADKVEATSERESLTKELSDLILEVFNAEIRSVSTIGYGASRELNEMIARRLIESGWRKGDPK